MPRLADGRGQLHELGLAHSIIVARLSVLVALLVGAACACGAGVQTRPELAGDGRGAVYDSAGVCDALARVAAADRTSGRQADGVTDWQQLQPLIVSSSLQAADLYDEARAVAPDELSDALALVGGVTRRLADAAAEAPSQAAFQRRGQRLSEFAEAQVAIAQLNRYSRLHCGFTLADN